MTARRLPASTRPTTHCSATFSPSSISLEFHIPDDWICEKDEAVEHQEGMAEILRHTKKAPATKEKQMEGKFADEAMKNNRCISSVTIFGACSLLYDHYP
uniref:Uncharacterized protein n=1 Tax=Oryza nivara TaxID=4536 RepID=A0A0E0IZB1_ORYNI